LGEVQTRYFSFDELDPEQSWNLLKWCMERGADEFTISALVASAESARMRAFFQALAAFTLPAAPRRQLSAPSGGQLTREVDRWRLQDASLGILQTALPMGFASREYDVDLWLEDLAAYRDGDFMMGVLSHEGGGVLRVTESELQELRAAGFPDRDEVPWVGF
jgi:hypothetical protein